MCLYFLLHWRYECVFPKPQGNYMPGVYLQKCESSRSSLLDVFVFPLQAAEEAGLLPAGQPARLSFSPVHPSFSFSASLKQR